MKRQFAVYSSIYLIILLILSFTWIYLPYSNRSIKGDDFFFCLELVTVSTVVYLIIVRSIYKTQFPLHFIFLAPILIFVASIIFLVIISVLLRLNDYQSLKVYFYISGIITVGIVKIILKHFTNKSL